MYGIENDLLIFFIEGERERKDVSIFLGFIFGTGVGDLFFFFKVTGALRAALAWSRSLGAKYPY